MAYNLKYELFFSDVEENKFKIEILQKDFILDPFNTGVQPTQIIGTGNPVQIKWDADDDIYSPIIGSRCILNFFVTDTTIYDDFYKSGEREYKVKILEYTSFGSDLETEELPYNLIDQNWDGKLGSEVFFNPIWEGFIVNDGYKEAVVSAPYEIQLEAIDGLGTLESFDVPFPSDNASAKEKMFFYLKEILKLTGHEFQIYIANDIRKNGATANDTIFHDIEVDRYIFSNKNLILMDAKQALKHILLMTNSRIFQSFAKWYVVNNSSLIDNRIVQGTVAPSAVDIINEPAAPVATPVYGSPDVSIDGVAQMYHNTGTSYRLIAVEDGGTEVIKWTWNLPGGGTVVQNDPTNQFFGEYSLGLVSSSQDGDSYTVTGEDANGQTDTSAAFVLNIDTYNYVTTPPSVVETGESSSDSDLNVPSVLQDVSYDLRINADSNFNVTNAIVSPANGTLAYGAGEVGDAFTMNFNVFSNVGEFTSASQLTGVSVTGGFSVSHALSGDVIIVTVTGSRPIGSTTELLVLTGAADVQQFTHSFSVTDSATNASISPSSFSAAGGDGQTYTKTFDITASSGYKWQSAGNVTVISNSVIYDSLTVSKVSDSVLRVTIAGTIGVSDKSATITVTGQPVGAAPATSISLSPSPTYEIAQNSGYFDVSVTADGNYRIEPDRSWLSFNPSSGVPGTQTVRVKFKANNKANTRSNSINFFPSGSNSVLLSAAVQQDGIA